MKVRTVLWLLFLSYVVGQFCLPPEVLAAFATGCTPAPAFKAMLVVDTTKDFIPNPLGMPGPATGTARIYQILNDAAVTSDQIMHAIMANGNARDTGDDFVKLQHRDTGKLPDTFPTNYKDVQDNPSKCGQALSFYGWDPGADACKTFLTYIGASLTLKADSMMHAIIHNSNTRDTLTDFYQIPQQLTGWMPSDDSIEFPKNFEELWDATKWPVAKLTTLLQYYLQDIPDPPPAPQEEQETDTPTEKLPNNGGGKEGLSIDPQLLQLRFLVLEYIGAPVSLLRDTILHYQEFNYNAATLNQQFKKLPHAVTGQSPTIPYPRTMDEVLSGEFTAQQITDLLKFYYQVPVSDKIYDLQIQLLSYIGAKVT